MRVSLKLQDGEVLWQESVFPEDVGKVLDQAITDGDIPLDFSKLKSIDIVVVKHQS